MIKTGLKCLTTIILCTSILLSACSEDNSSKRGSTGSGGQVTVNVGFGEAELSKAQVEAWNKSHKDIKIKLIDMGQAGKLQSMLASGNAPDIIRVQAASELSGYVIKGIAKNLQPYFDKDRDVFDPGDFLPVIDEYKFDGKVQGQGDLYGFVKDWSQDFTVWYNKKIFDQAGIPYPSATEPMTWEQVFNLAKNLTVINDGKVKQYGLGYYNGGTQLEESLLLLQLGQLGKSAWSDDFKKANFESPTAQKIIQMWVDAVKGNLGPNDINQDANWSGSSFIQGKMAMFISGYWTSGMFRTSKDVKDMTIFGMAPAPVMDGGTRMDPTGAAVGGIIYSKTKHPDETWEVFKYIFAGEPANDRAKSGWGLPGYKSKMTMLPQNTPWDKEVLDVQNRELNYAAPFLQYNPYVDLASVNTVISKYMKPVYFGKDTVESAVKKIDKDLNNLIQSGMQAAGVD